MISKEKLQILLNPYKFIQHFLRVQLVRGSIDSRICIKIIFPKIGSYHKMDNITASEKIKQKQLLKLLCGRNVNINALIRCCNRSVSINDDRVKKTYEEVLNEWQALPCNYRSINRWKNLEVFFVQRGLFRLSAICRGKAKESVYNAADKGLNPWRIVQCETEDGQISSATIHIKELAKKWWVRFLMDDYREMKHIINLFNGKKYQGKSKFSKFLKDKEIIIVGPVLPQNAIKKKDNQVIVRNNVLDEKVDVAYYNGQCIHEKVEGNSEAIESISECVNYKRVKWDAFNYINNLKNVAPINTFDLLSFNGTFNMLPIMLFDLLYFDSLGVKIYGNNLYIGETLHATDYVVTGKDIEYMMAFVGHLPSLNFVYIRNIYKSKLFVADNTLERILNMRVDEYMKALETRFA